MQSHAHTTDKPRAPHTHMDVGARVLCPNDLLVVSHAVLVRVIAVRKEMRLLCDVEALKRRDALVQHSALDVGVLAQVVVQRRRPTCAVSAGR